MDLQERLKDAIVAGTGIKLKLGYLLPGDGIGLVPAPGSAPIEEDYAGVQTWKYNFSVTIRTRDAEEAGSKLYAIQRFLNNLQGLTSNDQSFSFQSLDVSSAASLLLQDTQGFTTFALDLTAYVLVQKQIN